MATKSKSHPLNNHQHTAGIFSDMSIDGPVIGTLVLIVDRAKNLPNRKTIGKQDPYCAARLGKEAQKTTTDIRGGQTPKWDQELRFTVHDSPDYYQLKVSVFNDDKKTELIGETWIDLRDIIVAGGGQNDLWQNLSCKGKYAGEIRIEITFYDSRPKPDKPAVKQKPVGSENETSTGSQRSAPKRRPLPSDPFTGQVPAQPPQQLPEHSQTPRHQPHTPRDHAPSRSTPDHLSTPSRAPQPNPPVGYIPNQSPLQAVEYSIPPPVPHKRQQDQYSPAPSSAYETPPQRIEPQSQYRGPADRYDQYSGFPDDRVYSPDHQGHTPDRRYTAAAPYGTSPGQYDASPQDDARWAAPPEDDRPPPPPVHRTRNNSSNSHELYTPPRELALPQSQTPTASTMRKEVLRTEAHRQSVSNGSAYPGRPVYRAYDSAPAQQIATPPVPTGGNSHQPSPPRHHSYDPAYDALALHRSMQATVEDVPDSPGPQVMEDSRRSGSRAPQYSEPEYRKDPSPAPLNLSGRGSASAPQYNASTVSSNSSARRPSLDVTRSDLSLSSRDYTSPTTSQTSYNSISQTSYSPYNPPSQEGYTPYRSELDDTQVRAPDGTMRYALPAPVPASLIPGIDPNLSTDIAQRVNDDRYEDRRHHERRYTQPPPQSVAPLQTPPRGRQMIEPPPSYSANTSPQPYASPQQPSDSYDCGPAQYAVGQSSYQAVRRREPSPSVSPGGQQHTIRRKSISPAPPPDGRRLSGVPFGPDSYDALNTNMALTASREPGGARAEYNEANGKIITHDGKEVDPSDHLPMETWAPEPEPREKKQPAQSAPRPGPDGPQPVTASGRRPLKYRETRPTPMAALPAPTYISPEANATPSPPMSAGRNRLQKKANRASAMPVMSGANGNGSSPLAPLPQPFHQDSYSTPPRQIARASTFDSYPNENHAPMYGSSPSPGAGGDRYGTSPSNALVPRDPRGGSVASAPPVPAKIPLPMSGALVPVSRGGYGGGGAGGGDWALAEEMSRIDIGTGRARRHGQRGY